MLLLLVCSTDTRILWYHSFRIVFFNFLGFPVSLKHDFKFDVQRGTENTYLLVLPVVGALALAKASTDCCFDRDIAGISRGVDCPPSSHPTTL